MMVGRWSRFRRGLVEQYPALDPATPRYRWLVLAGVMIVTFMAVLDMTIVNVALPKLMATFGVSVDRVDWVLTAYLLIFAVMLPSSGWLADHVGYKRMFIGGLALFIFGSFLCSLAWSLDVLVVFRIVQGAGAGLVMPIGMAIVTREFPPEKRGIALGFWSMASSASVSLGPTLGGYLIDHYSWHTIFDVNVPVGLFGLVVLLVVLREYRTENTRTFDLAGFLSLSAFLTSLLLALSSGNSAWNTGGWTSTYILVCFGIAAASLVTFLFMELGAEHPLIDLRLFGNFNFGVSNIAMFLFGLGMFGSTLLLPVYLQNSLNYTPLQAGLVFLPVGIMQGLAAPLAGFYTDRHNPKVPLMLGLVIMAVTFYQFSFLSLQSETREIMIPLYLRGFAMGILFPPLTTLAISEIANHRMAQASAMINVVRQIGGSVGVAIFGSILIQRANFHATMYGIQVDPHSPVLQRTLMRMQYAIQHAGGGTVQQASVQARALLGSYLGKQAFVSAVDDVFLAVGVVLILCLVPIFFLRAHQKPRRPAPATGAGRPGGPGQPAVSLLSVATGPPAAVAGPSTSKGRE
jgi:MFS transporter, DHA2 family, multidrug resistance protein